MKNNNEEENENTKRKSMKNIDSIIANAQKLMINEDFWSGL